MYKLLGALLFSLLLVSCKDVEDDIAPQIDEYIEANAINATTTASGLRYEIIEVGNGEYPINNSIVSFEYILKMIDGRVLESSDEAIETYLSTTVAGLAEGLKLMKTGAKAIFVMPPDLAYGAVGNQNVPGDVAVVFEVTLLEIDNQIQEDILNYINEKGIDAIEGEKGLFYSVLEEGGNDKPNDDSTIRIRYKGMFLDGEVFDQSNASGVNFELNRLIESWRIGVPLIGKGGKIRLISPPQLAYGANGTGGIPGNSILDFEIDLIDFN